MGRKLDALLGRKGFKSARFKAILGMAVSRIAVLKNKHNIRCSQARNDVAQLLILPAQQERALLRVEHVIKEQNMLDVFLVVEGYCNLLIERVALLENTKGECPEELREAIAGVIFAASRCGEFPELQEIRLFFTSKFGREFTDSAVELRNNCGINPKMIQKLSTRQPSIECRRKVLKEIALENGITWNLDEASDKMEEINLNQHHNQTNQNQSQNQPNRKISEDVGGNGGSSVKSMSEDSTRVQSELDPCEQFSDSMKRKKKYADVASAAQAAFESAAYAAEAARAAVELSRSESLGKGSDAKSSPSIHKRWDEGTSRSRTQIGEGELGGILGFEKIHPVQNSPESEPKELLVKLNKIRPEKFRGKHRAQLERSASVSSSDSIELVTVEETNIPSNVATKPLEGVMVFDKSDDETENEEDKIFAFKRSEQRRSGGRTGDRFPKNSQFSAFLDEEFSDKNEASKLHDPFQKQNQRRIHQQNQKERKGPRNEDNYATSQVVNNEHSGSTERIWTEHSNVEKQPASVRTRRGFQ